MLSAICQSYANWHNLASCGTKSQSFGTKLGFWGFILLAVIVKEPLLRGKQVSEGSTKVFLLTLGNQIIPCKDCGNEKFLVYIDATTDWNRFTHIAPPF